MSSDPFDGTPYRLRRRLASGAMGEVFVVEHRELGSVMVAKVLHPWLQPDAQLVDRMRVEAQALGKLNHPNIVSIVGVGTTRDQRPFLVTEYLKGRTLADELAQGNALPPLDALVYACQTLRALGAAHAIGIVHRDIKPENLFLTQQPDGALQLKVLDFGIARVIPGVSAQAPQPLALPTDTGLIVGTPRYLSPEGALGQHADHRADIYSVGVVLYQMLTGRCPFNSHGLDAELILAHVAAQPEPPSRHARAPLYPELDAAVLKALNKKPEDRFQTARQFEAVLSNLAALMIQRGDVGLPANEGTQPLPLLPTSKRRLSRFILIFVLVVLTSAIAVVTIARLFGGFAQP